MKKNTTLLPLLSLFLFLLNQNLVALSAPAKQAKTADSLLMIIIPAIVVVFVLGVVIVLSMRKEVKSSGEKSSRNITTISPSSKVTITPPSPKRNISVTPPSASPVAAPPSAPSNAPPATANDLNEIISKPAQQPPSSSIPTQQPVQTQQQQPVQQQASAPASVSSPPPQPKPAQVASQPAPAKAVEQNKPLFDSNKLESDLDSIFADPSAVAKPEEPQKKPSLFDSNQLDDDLDALFIEVNKQPEAKKEEKKGLFDSSQLDSDLDSLFSDTKPEPKPVQQQAFQPSILDSQDLSSLFGSPEPAKTEQKPAASSAFDLDSLDFMGGQQEEKKPEAKSDSFSLPSFDLSSLTGTEPAKTEQKPAASSAFDLDSLDFMGGQQEEKKSEAKSDSFSLPSLDLSSLTGSSPLTAPAKDVPPLVPSADKIDLSTTTMGLNISEYLNSIQATKAEQKKSEQFELSDTIPPQTMNVADLQKGVSPVSEQLISETSSEAKKKQKGEGGIIAIGKMLVDQNALEEIIKKAEKGGKAGLTTTQVITAVKGRSLDTLLVDINNIDGIMGCIIVGKDGLVIANTMPPEIDKDLVGALTSSLFSNIDVQIKKLKKGVLKRLTVETEIGTYILTEIEMGTLVVFSDEDSKINLSDVFKAITTVTGKR